MSHFSFATIRSRARRVYVVYWLFGMRDMTEVTAEQYLARSAQFA